MHSITHLRTLVLVGIMLSIVPHSHRCEAIADEPADGIGVWDGAIWRFVLTAEKGNPRGSPLRGRYRVENLKMYQADSMDGKDMSRKVGVSEPGPGKRPQFTKVDFKDLKAFGQGRDPVIFKELKGRLGKGDEPGEVKGRVISNDGLHWEFKATRVRE